MSIETIDLNYIFGSMGSILAITACTAGVGWRTWSKYGDKIKEGENIKFDLKFVYQALGSLVGALMLAIPLLSAGTEMLNQWAGSVGLLIAWLLTAGWAYALNDGANGIIKRIEKSAVQKAVKSGMLDSIIQRKVEAALEKQANQ